jgi:hypothetical protein
MLLRAGSRGEPPRITTKICVRPADQGQPRCRLLDPRDVRYPWQRESSLSCQQPGTAYPTLTVAALPSAEESRRTEAVTAVGVEEQPKQWRSAGIRGRRRRRRGPRDPWSSDSSPLERRPEHPRRGSAFTKQEHGQGPARHGRSRSRARGRLCAAGSDQVGVMGCARLYTRIVCDSYV